MSEESELLRRIAQGASPTRPEGSGARCGLPLILLWGLQAMIDEGLITSQEAAEMLLGKKREPGDGA